MPLPEFTCVCMVDLSKSKIIMVRSLSWLVQDEIKW